VSAQDGRLFADLATVRAGAATHPGHHRRLNEDDHLVAEHVYVVADGMGGHAAGDQASAIVVDEMRDLVGRPVDAVEVNAALERAAERVRGLDVGPAGTTVAAAIGVEREGAPYWLVANLGDSRTYRFARGVLAQVSVDHSVVQELVDSGRLPVAEARTHPDRHVVTRAVGAPQAIDPDFWLLPVQDGERLVLCSDGLSSEADDEDIAATLGRHADPQSAADALVELALQRGGHDNVTVLVLDARADGGLDEGQTQPRIMLQELREAAEELAP
jgi:serine/threonine protein phosphatase PrpC